MSEAIRRAITAGNETFMAALRNGDGAAIAALYTADARVLPPGGPMVEGREAISGFWQYVIGSGVKDARLETLSVETAGEALACEVGRAVLTIQPAGGEAVTAEGKYVVLWKEDGGGWKLHVDIWNLNA